MDFSEKDIKTLSSALRDMGYDDKEYTDEQLKVLARNKERNLAIMSQLRQLYLDKKPTIVFACSVDHAKMLVIKFSNASEAAFCLESVEDYDENDETQVEFPYVQRAFGIFEQIKQLYKVINPNAADSYIKLCGYINLIDEMLENIKLCIKNFKSGLVNGSLVMELVR